MDLFETFWVYDERNVSFPQKICTPTCSAVLWVYGKTQTKYVVCCILPQCFMMINVILQLLLITVHVLFCVIAHIV